MAWRKNKRLVESGYADLAYVPSGKSGWDATLAALAYGVRMDADGGVPDLNAWAARHGAAPSAVYEDLGESAWVLWHGTSRARAEKIAEHGLFHKRGVWAAVHPAIPHGFCRDRSERFTTEGAVVCLVLDRAACVEGRDYEIETAENVIRFHHGLPPEVAQYILVHDEIPALLARTTVPRRQRGKTRFLGPPPEAEDR